MTERQRTVALLIDYDNLQICYSRDAPGTQLDLGAVVALAQNYGRVVVARAYAEWNLLSERLAVYKAGIEPAFAPVLRPEGSNREGKSLADTVMVADGVDLLWTHQPDVLVMVTSDKDMLPLARIAKQRGCLVVVLGSDLTAVQLLEMANEFVTYRHLVRELGRDGEKLPPGRMREEPRLRRSRDPFNAQIDAAREASLREPRTPPGRPRSGRVATALPPPAARPAPLAPSPAPLPAPPIAAPAVGAGATAGDGDTGGDEVQPMATRRRRRRRRGRTGLGDEYPGAEAGSIEGGGAEDDRVDLELTLAGDLVEAEAGREQPEEVEPSEASMAAAPVEIAEPPVVRPARRPRERRREPEARPEAGREEPAREEPAQLRPWERWPEPARTPDPPVRRSARPSRGTAAARQAEAAPASSPRPDEPATERSPAVVTAGADERVDASVERAGMPPEEVQAEVAAEWSPSAVGEGGTSEGGTSEGEAPEGEAKPARRPRRRRPAASRATAGAGAAEGGE